MRAISSRPLVMLWTLAVVVVAVWTATAFAQPTQLVDKEIKKEFDKISPRYEQLLKGAAIPDPNGDKGLLDVVARYMVLRVALPTLQQDVYDKGMGAVQRDFKTLMEHPSTIDAKNQEFMKQLVPHLITSFDKVFKLADDFQKDYTAVTNAALMLPVLAKCRQDKVHDYLLTLAGTDGTGKLTAKQPIIRMCAIKGLGEFNVPGGKGPPSPARDLARLDAIQNFIVKPYEPQGKGKDYEDAFSYVRREGIKALAHLQTPAFDTKQGKVTGPVAFMLLSAANGAALRSDQVGPLYSLSEKLEAAIGICNLKAAQTPEYNAEVAAYIVANVLVEMAEVYREDYRYFSGKEKDKEAPTRVPMLPWKTYATRFDMGLDAMFASVPNSSPASKKIDGLRGNPGAAKAMLSTIARGNRLDPQPALEAYAKSIRPAAPEVEVYQGHKGFAIVLPKQG